MHPRLRCSLVLTFALFLFQADGGLRGSVEDAGFTLDLPVTANARLPSWLSESPRRPAGLLGEEFRIRPVDEASDLAVTICFDEPSGGFIRVYWSAGGRSQMLCENLLEGSGLPNQRTLVISRTTVGAEGGLVIESDGGIFPVWRIRWDWVRGRQVKVAAAQGAAAMVNDGGRVLADREVAGAPAEELADSWRNGVISATLSQKPRRIEDGVEFSAAIEKAPDAARLEGWFAGRRPGQEVILWVNGERVGVIALETPPLTDPGYRGNATGGWEYAGWMRGVAFLDPKLLRSSDNTFQFAAVEGASPSSHAVALKNLVIQLKYPDAASPAAPVPHPTSP